MKSNQTNSITATQRIASCVEKQCTLSSCVHHLEDRTALLRTWLVIFGHDRLSFFCQAEDVEHAIEQCRNAYPDEKVIKAMRIPDAGDNLGADERKTLLDEIASAIGMPIIEVEVVA